jgi:DNA polymerase/3'-5' exonuclease PolX
MLNKSIISEFERLILYIKQLIDDHNQRENALKNSFRLRQITKALNIIKKLNFKITTNSSKQLLNMSGIGPGTLKRIDEILKNKYLKEIKLNSKFNKYNKEIEELEQIFSIGRVKAIELILKYNIRNIKQLQEAYNNNKITLSHQAITSLKYVNTYRQNILRQEITNIDNMLQQINKDKNLIITICGSYRREKATSNDIDILISDKTIITKKDLKENKINKLHDFVKKLKQINFIIDELTFENYTTKFMGYCQFNSKSFVRRIDIYNCPYESYYASLLHLTGSGEFNRKMRFVANSLGYLLNEYGLFYLNKKKLIKINSEDDIFKKLNLEYVEPKDRDL